MPNLPSISRASTADAPIIVSPQLHKALRKAMIERPADGTRLSGAQLDQLLAGKPPGERIYLKQLVAVAGVYPREPSP